MENINVDLELLGGSKKKRGAKKSGKKAVEIWRNRENPRPHNGSLQSDL